VNPHLLLSLRLAALCVLLAVAGALPAQTGGWYAVEVIVFAHPGGDARYAESWRPDPGLPEVARAAPPGAGVEPVSPSAYRMSGIWQALKASPGYRPLRHLGWVQRGASRARAPLVRIGEDPGAGVFGTVQVSRGRFLHVDVDLLYQDGDGRYRFRASRRMRSNEIHYLDHPVFGVLVTTTPLQG